MAAPNQRQGTMEVTAKEGVEYLKAAGEDKLLKMQGLDANGAGDEAPKVEKDGTMAATVKEGEELLEREGGAPEGRTRSGDKAEAEEDVPAKKLKRDGTMAATAKEGEALVGEAELGGTRAETEAIKEGAEDPTPSPTKTHTMEATTKEAEALLEGEAVGGTRSETEATKAAADEESSNTGSSD